jgi:hypothetical protein
VLESAAQVTYRVVFPAPKANILKPYENVMDPIKIDYR